MKIIVDITKCPQNHKCLAIGVCPVHAIKQNKCSAPTINQDTCTQCGQCVNFCPMEALKKIN